MDLKYIGTLSKSELLDFIAGKKVFTSGAAMAVGSIAFAGQPDPNDTITVAGVTFTYKASATLNTEIAIGALLTNTIDNTVTKLLAHPSTSKAAGVLWSAVNTGGTTVTLTYYPGVSSEKYLLAASLAGTETITQPTGGTGRKTLSTKHRVNEIQFTNNTKADEYFVLPNGFEGQVMTVYMSAMDTSGSTDIAHILGTFKNGTSAQVELQLNTIAEYANLVFLNGAWTNIGASTGLTWA
jgi:hypothetical protein